MIKNTVNYLFGSNSERPMGKRKQPAVQLAEELEVSEEEEELEVSKQTISGIDLSGHSGELSDSEEETDEDVTDSPPVSQPRGGKAARSTAASALTQQAAKRRGRPPKQQKTAPVDPEEKPQARRFKRREDNRRGTAAAASPLPQQQEAALKSAAGKQRAGKRRGRAAAAAAPEERQQEQQPKQAAGAAEAVEREAQEVVRAAKRSRSGAAQPPTADRQGKQERKQRKPGLSRRQSEEEEQQREEEGEEEAAATSPAAAGGKHGGRSPTPVVAAAAAQPLEMSAPPQEAAPAAAAAASQLEQRQQSQRLQQSARGPAEAAQQGSPEAGADVDDELDAEQETEQGGTSNPASAACSFLRRRLTQPRGEEARTTQLRPRLQEAYQSLLHSLDNTVELGHNNSLLVMGPRGSGKTLVTERALAALEQRWNSDPRDPVVGVIRLSGLFHAEERTAFREVARQLCEAFKYTFSRGASVGENIDFLRGMLEALTSSEKSVVFVLDEFDLFATKRSKQTLLYNLLDALQTSGMNAAVVGLTCRQDVIEMLEKRVKSRFSHRKLDLSLPTSVPPVAAKEVQVGGALVHEAAQDGALDVLKAMLTLPPQFPHGQFAAEWNASMEAAAGAAEVQAALQRCINIYPSLRHLANVADVALTGALRAGGARLTAQLLLAAVERQLSYSKSMVSAVSSLCVLDLALLVAAHRVVLRAGDRGPDDFNFEMLYRELTGYTSRGSQVDAYGKAAASKAYDHLLSQGLVAFVDPRSEARVGSRQYAAAYLQVTREEVEQGIADHWNPPQALQEWFKREGGLGTTAGQFL